MNVAGLALPRSGRTGSAAIDERGRARDGRSGFADEEWDVEEDGAGSGVSTMLSREKPGIWSNDGWRCQPGMCFRIRKC